MDLDTPIVASVRVVRKSYEMAERPERPNILSLDEDAAIERCRQLIQNQHARATWDLLFPMQHYRDGVVSSPQVPQSLLANLLVQLRDYSSALFDCEAAHYLKRAADEPTLKHWLEQVSECIPGETISETSARFEGLDCPIPKRMNAVNAGLKARVEYWANRKKEELAKISPGPTVEYAAPLPVRGRSGYAREDVATNKPAEVKTGQDTSAETIGDQIERLRQECDLTREELAEKTGIDASNVSRHARKLSIPSSRTRKEYEQFFSKRLGRKVLLSRTQPNATKRN